MNEVREFLNYPAPIWLFGSLMYTFLWFLNHQHRNFRGAWRPAYYIIAWSLIIGMSVGIALTGIFLWKFGLWSTIKSLFYASVIAAIFTILLQRITTHSIMLVVSFLGWPASAYVIAKAMFR